MSDLKSCQHCESTQTHFERWLEETDHGGKLYKMWYRIVCVVCQFTPDHWEETAEAAILYWNTRPIEDALLSRALAAERELAELKERTRWHKYPDEKPDEYAPVFTVFEDEIYTTHRVLQGEYCHGIFLDLGGDIIKDVTFWWPIPEPPEAENE